MLFVSLCFAYRIPHSWGPVIGQSIHLEFSGKTCLGASGCTCFLAPYLLQACSPSVCFCWPASTYFGGYELVCVRVCLHSDVGDAIISGVIGWAIEDGGAVSKIRILLADDHAVVREGTKELLEREADLAVVAEASDGKEAVQLAIRERPDVVVMDFAMPQLNGIEATRQIKAIAPGIAVLVLTAYDSDQYIFGFLEAGAAGYLLKDVHVNEVINAIRAVHAGESVLHPTIARRVIDRFVLPNGKRTEEDALEDLTEREMEVLKLAATGRSNREIGTELTISVRTVQTHLNNVFNKMGVGSRTEAVIYALRKGWITLEDTF